MPGAKAPAQVVLERTFPISLQRHASEQASANMEGGSHQAWEKPLSSQLDGDCGILPPYCCMASAYALQKLLHTHPLFAKH